MRGYSPLIWFVIGFLFGILLGGFWNENEVLKFGVLGLMGFFGAMVYLSWKKFCWFVIAVVVGFLRFDFSLEEVDVAFDGGISRGCVVDEPDVRVDKVKYVVAIEGVGNVLVNAPRYPVYDYGECLIVDGRIEKPDKIEDFDYGNYLARYGIDYVVYRGKVDLDAEVDGAGVGSAFLGGIFELKKMFSEKLNELYSEPHGSFMAGLLLGSRKGIPEALLSDFNVTGLTHIIAISGYNITLIIVLVSAFLGFMSRKWKVVFSAVFVVLFVVFVGMSAAVVRAAIMGVIGLLALWFGRIYFVEISLFMAAFLMNLWNPKILLYDAGFQLSFLATAGLIYCPAVIEKWFRWLPNSLAIRESVMMTMSAQIFALPIMLGSFERLSVIAPVANVFVLPMIPLAMLFGFCSVIAGILAPIVGVIVGFFGFIILEITIFFVKFFAGLPFASIEVGWWSWALSLFYYLFIVIFFLQKREI